MAVKRKLEGNKLKADSAGSSSSKLKITTKSVTKDQERPTNKVVADQSYSQPDRKKGGINNICSKYFISSLPLHVIPLLTDRRIPPAWMPPRSPYECIQE